MALILQNGEAIRRLRDQNEWSQQRVAEKLDICPTQYSNIERMDCNTSVETLQAIADLFGVDFRSLVDTPSEEEIY